MLEEPLQAGGEVSVGHLVGSLEKFKAGHWRRHPLHQSRASSTGFRELISLADIDYLLADPRTRPPYLRVTQNARKLDNTLITRQATVARQPVPDAPDTAAVMRHFENGATITIDSLQDSIPAVGNLCREIASSLMGDVHAIAFITPPGRQGFTSHLDAKEAIILQFAGTKKWRIYNCQYPVPLKNAIIPAAQVGEPIMEIELKAGDVLYVPWGYPHDATSGDVISAHLSLMIRPPTWSEILMDVLAETLTEESLGESPEWSRTQEAPFKDDFLSRLDTLCQAIGNPEYRNTAAEIAWQSFLKAGMKDSYPTIAELSNAHE
jgi:ribosomal protein L16 Arg81 hydroxylase